MDKFVNCVSRPRRKRIHSDENEDDEDLIDDQGLDCPVEPEPSPVSTNVPIVSAQNYLLDGKYYKIISINGSKMIVSCQNCSKTINAHSTSTGNLLSHYKVSDTYLFAN